MAGIKPNPGQASALPTVLSLRPKIKKKVGETLGLTMTYNPEQIYVLTRLNDLWVPGLTAPLRFRTASYTPEERQTGLEADLSLQCPSCD